MQFYEKPQKTTKIRRIFTPEIFQGSKHTMTLENNSPWIRKTSYATLYLSVDEQPYRLCTNGAPNNLANKLAT